MDASEAQGLPEPGAGWRWYEGAGAILVLGIGGLTAVDVVGRYFLGQPLKGAFDLIEVLMALSVFWFMPLISRDDGHISVGLFKTRPRSALDAVRRVAIEGCCLLTAAIVSWQLARTSLDFMRQGEVSLIIGLPKGPVVAACAAIGAVVALAHGVRLVSMLRRGRGVGP